jgi:hypothetical protein
MTAERASEITSRMQQAIDELKDMIQARYPAARFRVSRSPDDPNIMHLVAVVDVEDTDAVMDVVVERMMELQIDDHLPLFVVPVRPHAAASRSKRPTPRRRASGPPPSSTA